MKNFSTIARPLYNLTKEGIEFEFDTKCMGGLDNLKQALITDPVLAIYDPKRETELHTDASALGFSAVLMQKQNDGKCIRLLIFQSQARPNA